MFANITTKIIRKVFKDPELESYSGRYKFLKILIFVQKPKFLSSVTEGPGSLPPLGENVRQHKSERPLSAVAS